MTPAILTLTTRLDTDPSSSIPNTATHVHTRRSLTPQARLTDDGCVGHCIVGRNFGSFVTHGTLQLSKATIWWLTGLSTETKHFIYFYVGNLAVLLYKTA